MKSHLEDVTAHLEELALETVMLDPADIPALGRALNSIEQLMDMIGKEAEDLPIQPVLQRLKDYLEQMVMGAVTDLAPVETAVAKLQEICRKRARSDPVDAVLAEALALFGENEGPVPVAGGPPPDAATEGPGTSAGAGAKTAISDEDRAIILDFAAEALENLSAIEIGVMDLEQDPADSEIVNAIFRPFHTIKGVSGFLNFTRINHLSHSVENLLDKARNHQLPVTEELIDIVLDSVDLLRRMIQDVQASFVETAPEEGGIDIRPFMDRVEAYVAGHAGDRKKLGEMLVDRGIVTAADLQNALKLQERDKRRRLGEILVENKKAESKDVVSALREQRRYEPQGSFQVKVDTDKLDNIVDMVGELAIAQSMLRQNPLVQSTSDRRLFQIVNQLNVITSSLQKTAMSLRMVPISQSFQKMLRLVRDLAKKAGKEVELRITGEETEIDRNMVEEIYEPMVHMIRNAIDHGIEPPEERTANRKPARGTIYLKAYHKGGDIVIEIADDGRGLNKEKIRQKAIANGLIEENENPSDEEIQNLIFQPGFSTADKVTDISGRGVGTDVVKSKIEKLRGRVEVKSTPGQGTRFFMRLPLTLAIVDGIVVKVGQERYILPTLSVKEFYKPEKRDYFTVKGKGEMIKVRQDLIPLVRLDRWANGHGGSHPPTDGDPPWKKTVVVVEHQGKLRCLLVDELVGQEEVVIKSLGQWLRKVEGIAGGAILGDGRVGLIVDISGVFEMQVEG